jgi:hypothetical protein
MNVPIVAESFIRSNALIAAHSIWIALSAIQTDRDSDSAELQAAFGSPKRLRLLAKAERRAVQIWSLGSLRTELLASIRTDRSDESHCPAKRKLQTTSMLTTTVSKLQSE